MNKSMPSTEARKNGEVYKPDTAEYKVKRGLRSPVMRKLVRNRLALAGLILIVIITASVIFAPFLAPYDPLKMSLINRHQPPSLENWMGTDFFGRDIFSRILYGGRISLMIGFIVIVINAAIGLPLGLISGYFGGVVDQSIMRVTDTLIAFPTLLFALAITALHGVGMATLVLALTFKGWTNIARLVRAEVLKLREQDYVLAAGTSGATRVRVILRHILPNSLAAFIVYTTLGITTPILAEAALSFLGMGIQPPQFSWGVMINTDRHHIRTAWWSVTFPGLAIMVTVLAFNLLGDGLRDALDPKLKD